MHTEYLEFLFNKDAKSIVVNFVNVFKTFEQQVENANKVMDYIHSNKLTYCAIGPEHGPTAGKDYYKDYRLLLPESEDDPNLDAWSERDDQIDLVQSTIVINVTKLDEQKIKQIGTDLYNLADVEIEFQ